MGLQDMMENDMTNIIQPDPKLQQDLVDVLLRFTRYPVALVCIHKINHTRDCVGDH